MTMAALRAMGSRADPSPYALTSLASSEGEPITSPA